MTPVGLGLAGGIARTVRADFPDFDALHEATLRNGFAMPQTHPICVKISEIREWIARPKVSVSTTNVVTGLELRSIHYERSNNTYI